MAYNRIKDEKEQDREFRGKIALEIIEAHIGK